MNPDVQQGSGPQRRLGADELDLMVRRLDSLPTFPAVAQKLLRLFSEAELEQPTLTWAETLAQAAAVIAADPPLAGKLMSLASAKRRGAGRSLTTAIDALGFEEFRSAAVTAEVFTEDNGVDHACLWKHSIATAIAAEMLAAHAPGDVDPDEAYVCGLLHDLGKMAMERCMPKSYRRALEVMAHDAAPAAECERKVIGVDHSAIGRRLAERWRLNPTLRDVIWLCHQPPETLPQSTPTHTLVILVSLADALARTPGLGLSLPAPPTGASEALAERLELSLETIGEIIEKLPALVEERFSLLGLDEPAVSGGAELGRLNEQLRRRATALSIEAAAFRQLQKFTAAIGPEATVADVLEQIAIAIGRGVEQDITPETPLVAYCLANEGGATLAVCIGGDQAEFQSLPSPRQLDGDVPANAAEAFTALGESADTLTAWLSDDKCVHQPLVCDGDWIGGVFYTPPPGALAEGRVSEIAKCVADASALLLAMVRSRSKTAEVGDQLIGATQMQAAIQHTLAEARTLAAAGQMAAGAAHEINTPLAVISGRAQLRGSQAKTDDEKKAWRLIADQAQTISDIVTDLMAFASPPPAKAEAFDVAELFAEAAEMFSSCDHPQAAAAQVDIEVGEETPRALADKAQICEAIVELMKNSASASEPQPQLRLSAEFDEINDAVMLTVADEGAGMDERTIERAFTPFFSLQKAGRRRGMGLPRVKRAVENNGGRVWIRSRSGHGATVFIHLPAAKS